MEQSVSGSANFISGLEGIGQCLRGAQAPSSLHQQQRLAKGSWWEGTECNNSRPAQLLVRKNCLCVKVVPRDTLGQQISIPLWLRTKGVPVLLKPLVCSGRGISSPSQQYFGISSTLIERETKMREDSSAEAQSN